MARKSGFVRRNNVMRRETLCLGDAITQTTIAAAGTAVLIGVLNAAALALRPFTIIRSRGFVAINSDQAAISEDQEIGYGEAVTTEQATAIGVTAVPTPLTDSDSDAWMVYEAMATNFRFLSSIGFESNGQLERIIDSKAMRKVESGFDLARTVETSATSEGVVVVDFVRHLVKLH